MVGRHSVTQKAIRIDEDWESFLNEHPDIFERKEEDRIVDVVFPEGSTNHTLLILNGAVYHLEYCLNGVYIKYTSPDVHESTIHKMVEEYNRKHGLKY